MPATATRRRTQRTGLVSGPYKGVRNTKDPFDDGPEWLQDLINGYIPDPFTGSGAYARPGFTVQNAAGALAGRGQAVYAHTALNGVVYNFVVAGGHLYRADATLTVFTDVTPVSGVTIDPDVTRIYFASFGDALVVSDGVTAPWVAGDLSSTPVTGTPIDFDGSGTAWAAYGQPVIYGGSLVFILDNVDGNGARTDIAWSVPGDPTTGYQQPDYDFRWTLEQTGSAPIYALAATNVALYYFRDTSIGGLSGIPGPNFRNDATHDAISVNVGTLQSATIVQFGTTIFFCDATGRPWMMPQGSVPQPIWLNLRAVVDNSTAAYPAATAQVACAAIELGHTLYCAAIWSPVPAAPNPPIELQVFDAKTGNYVGRWVIGHGIAIEAIGNLNNTVGRGALVVVGSLTQAPSAGGYVWAESSGGTGITDLVTEDEMFLLTEGGMPLTTENVPISWLDNGEVPLIAGTTQRLGYSGESVWNADGCTVITGTNAPCVVTMQTPNTAGTVEGIPSPSASQDDTFRLVVGADAQGRGIQVVVSPTTAESQWSLQQVTVSAIPSLASPEDP